MFELLLSIIISASAPLSAADVKQQAKPEIKVTTRTDDALISARRTRMAEISSHEKSGGAAAVNSLKLLLADKDPLVRGEAVAAMGRIKDPAAFTALSDAAGNSDAHVRWGAIQGLAALKDARAVPALIIALGHAERNTRWKAAEALGALKDARAADALARAAASDKDKNVRLAAIKALSEIGGPRAAAALADLKGDADPEIKAWAAACAGRAGQK